MTATVALYYLPSHSSEESSAPRRGCMSSGAAQLPRHRGGRCRHPRAVMGCRAPQRRQPERGLGRPAGRRRRRAVQDVRTPARRSLLCPRPLSACGRTSAQTGRADVWCPRDGCPRVRCDPGVRTDRRPVSAPPQPRCPHRAGSSEGVGAGPATFGAPGSTLAGVPERHGRGCPNRPGGEGWVMRCSAWLA